MDEKQKKKKPAGKRISAIIYNCIIVLLVIVAAILIVNRINHRATFVFGRSVILIATGSMEPEIPTGSCILVKKAGLEEIVAGDVITFYSDDPALSGNMNTHRVAGIAQGEGGIEFITKGDNNLVEDRYTAKAEKLVGKYVRVLPVMSAAASLLLSPVGFFTLIFALISLAAASFIITAVRGKKRSESEKKAEFDRKVAEEVERLRAESESGKDDDENLSDGTK